VGFLFFLTTRGDQSFYFNVFTATFTYVEWVFLFCLWFLCWIYSHFHLRRESLFILFIIFMLNLQPLSRTQALAIQRGRPVQGLTTFLLPLSPFWRSQIPSTSSALDRPTSPCNATSPRWSTYNRIWFSGPDKQEILILTSPKIPPMNIVKKSCMNLTLLNKVVIVLQC
jgi:hypothetical protein